MTKVEPIIKKMTTKQLREAVNELDKEKNASYKARKRTVPESEFYRGYVSQIRTEYKRRKGKKIY